MKILIRPGHERALQDHVTTAPKVVVAVVVAVEVAAVVVVVAVVVVIVVVVEVVVVILVVVVIVVAEVVFNWNWSSDDAEIVEDSRKVNVAYTDSDDDYLGFADHQTVFAPPNNQKDSGLN
ncbi:hypothetical protein DPMN_089134 [Dreissena polymorpha]|uniref:Uncharacterized protein n=1 Tax=Dreissena polymorpha TaxID=45954 RepID=A0A9D4QXX6_DREPO|nr:hypothetical protein DPMN_089134 [Dreissena polymorpha]